MLAELCLDEVSLGHDNKPVLRGVSQVDVHM